MFCTNCGKEIDDNSKFCPYCGATTEEEIEELGTGTETGYTEPEQPNGGYSEPQYQYNQPEPQMKSNKVPIIVLGVVLAIAAFGIGYFVMNGSSSNNTASSEVTTEEATDGTTEAVTTEATTQVTTEATTTERANSSDYMFPDSDSAYLSRSDVSGLSSWDLKVARNEIFARHGYIFKNSALKSYFESKSWYRGTRSSEIPDSELNSYEKENISLIKEYE